MKSAMDAVMPGLELARAYFSDATLGEIIVDGEPTGIYTAEQPWLNNEPFKSCIPEGVYKLEYTNGPKYGEQVCMVNLTLGISAADERPHIPRFCCIAGHVGNGPDDVEGCFVVGQSVGMYKGKPGVLSSRKAMEKWVPMREFFTHIKITSRRGRL